MSTAEDRFIAGAGALAALIRAQPAFEPPPRMLGQILTALEATPAPAGFEPPAALLDAVMAEAERIASAQAPRRDALLAELAAGKSASDALGAPVSPATAAWLAQQQSSPTPAPPRRRWPWLAGIGTAVTAALAVSVALRIVQETANPPPMPAALSKAAPAVPSASTTDQAIAYTPKPRETAERLAKSEAPPSAIAARARPSQAREAEARRVAPAAPATQPPMITEALRAAPAPIARLHAEADADAAAPATTISAPLDIPPATLAARMLVRPAPAWSMTVAAADETAGRALHGALVARLQTLGRSETVTLSIGGVAVGEVLLTPSPTPGRALQ